jgi:hypothetical protein
MGRSFAIALVLLPLAGAARADGGSISELRFSPGAGIGLVTLSLELNVEGRRWYAGAQLALAGAMRSAGVAAYSGVRAGAFLADGPVAPFLGLGLVALGETDGDPNSSQGLGASAEAGIAFRRDEPWFHPQIVVQAIAPLAQQKTTGSAYQPGPVVLLGFRILL